VSLPTQLTVPAVSTGETLTMYEAARVANETRSDLKARALDVLDWALHGFPVGRGFGPRLATTRTGDRYTTTRTALAAFLAAIEDLPAT
jgi:hypothetical protein